MPKDRSSSTGTLWERFKALLAQPVHGTSLAAMRIAVGLVMALEAWALAQPNRAAISMGTSPLDTYYIGPDIRFHFPYAGFEWLPLLPPAWIYALVTVQGLAGLTMALGFCYRASAAMVFLSWAYLFLVESTRSYWQSHYYLELLVTFLMVWMPAARRWSIDAWLARGRNVPATVPFWTLLLLRGQLVITYFYAGVAKLNSDWLLAAVPVRWFLREEHVAAAWSGILSPGLFALFQTVIQSVTLAYFISYVGLVFDLAVGFLFLCRRTRIFALVLMTIFHATNHFLIFDNIGFFPLLGLATALIFMDADWPERCWRWLRRPRLAKPDWTWFGAGAFLFPVVGVSLGWKLRATDETPNTGQRLPLSRWVVPGVVAWLVWQSLFPLRQYLIAGDGRFTYEGLSFSWRLKSDRHQARSAQVFIKDPALITSDEKGRNRIDWNQWHDEKVIYRKTKPGQIPWSRLPELIVLIEPILGERILFNPLSGFGPKTILADNDARDRLHQLWRNLYGAPPETIRRSRPLSQVLDAISDEFHSTGHASGAENFRRLAARARRFEHGNEVPPLWNDRNEILAALESALAQDTAGKLSPLLRSLEPFALDGQRPLPAPFLVIEDPLVWEKTGAQWALVKRSAWKPVPTSPAERSPLDVYLGGPPLVIYTGDIGRYAEVFLPPACVFDSLDRPDQPPYLWWNTLRDLPVSKLNHISNQAFYLRRYARRVAAYWETKHHRRPAVNAVTAVSLNGRPYQYLVDPTADLAGVAVTWFRHNHWIRDLETKRIPRESLTPANVPSTSGPGDW